MFRRFIACVISSLGIAIPCLTLVGCGKAGYSKVNGQWAWVGTNVNGRHETILNADRESFRVLDDSQYAKDNYRVFFRGKPILDADPALFVVLSTAVGPSGRLFSKDRNHVFLEGYQITGADPGSYEVIRPPFGRDTTRVYCGTVPMPGADPATFQITRAPSNWGGMTNKEFFVEHYGPAFADLEVSESHPAIASGGAWSRDAKYHYYDAARVEGADYDTFQPIDNWLAKDKDHEYHGRLRKEDFDRERQERANALRARDGK